MKERRKKRKTTKSKRRHPPLEMDCRQPDRGARFLIRFSRRTRPCYHTIVETSQHDSSSSPLFPSFIYIHIYIYIYYFFVGANNRLTLRSPRYNIFAGDAEFLKIAKPCHSFTARLPRHANILRHRVAKNSWPFSRFARRQTKNRPKSSSAIFFFFEYVCVPPPLVSMCCDKLFVGRGVFFISPFFSLGPRYYSGLAAFEPRRVNEKYVKWIFSYFFFSSFFIRNRTKYHGGRES